MQHLVMVMNHLPLDSQSLCFYIRCFLYHLFEIQGALWSYVEDILYRICITIKYYII